MGVKQKIMLTCPSNWQQDRHYYNSGKKCRKVVEFLNENEVLRYASYPINIQTFLNRITVFQNKIHVSTVPWTLAFYQHKRHWSPWDWEVNALHWHCLPAVNLKLSFLWLGTLNWLQNALTWYCYFFVWLEINLSLLVYYLLFTDSFYLSFKTLACLVTKCFFMDFWKLW